MGIKLWASCGISGIVYDFEIYACKAPNSQDEIPGIMMGGNVVHRLTKNLPYHQNFKLYFDNFFSSVTLMNILKEQGILAVVTLRKDRMKRSQNNLLPEKELKKKGVDQMIMLLKLTPASSQ